MFLNEIWNCFISNSVRFLGFHHAWCAIVSMPLTAQVGLHPDLGVEMGGFPGFVRDMLQHVCVYFTGKYP